MENKTVVITGGKGFVGRAIAQKLSADNWRIKILGRTGKDCETNLLSYIKTDYSVPHLTSALNGADAVIHCAAAISAPSYDEFYKANVIVTRNLVSACRTAVPDTFVHLSSLAAGGPAVLSDTPKNEEMPSLPISNYGRTKFLSEKEISALAPETSAIVFRPAIVYGKNDSGISQSVSWVKRGFLPNLSGDFLFSFLYIDDLVKAIETALTTPQKFKGEIYYLCGNGRYTWREFAETLAKSVGAKPPAMINFPPFITKAAGAVFSAVSRLTGANPIFNSDKAKEALAGHWIANAKKWEISAEQTNWTELENGLKKAFGNL